MSMFDPCDCGIKPEGHSHVVNDNNKVIFWKGMPIPEKLMKEYKTDEKKHAEEQ